VPTIREERHGMEFQSADDFDNHHDSSEQQDAASVLFSRQELAAKVVPVLPVRNILCVHSREPNLIAFKTKQVICTPKPFSFITPWADYFNFNAAKLLFHQPDALDSPA